MQQLATHFWGIHALGGTGLAGLGMPAMLAVPGLGGGLMWVQRRRRARQR